MSIHMSAFPTSDKLDIRKAQGKWHLFYYSGEFHRLQHVKFKTEVSSKTNKEHFKIFKISAQKEKKKKTSNGLSNAKREPQSC